MLGGSPLGLAPLGLWGLDLGPVDPGPTTIRRAIAEMLAGDPALSALVGGRIYPGGLPQDCELPAVTYVVAGTREPRNLAASTPYRSTRLRVSAWSNGEAEAEDVVEAVRARLVDFSGAVGTVRIASISVEGEVDQPESGADGDDAYTYQIVLDLRAWHRRV